MEITVTTVTTVPTVPYINDNFTAYYSRDKLKGTVISKIIDYIHIIVSKLQTLVINKKKNNKDTNTLQIWAVQHNCILNCIYTIQ